MSISAVPTGLIPVADALLGSKVGPYVLLRRIGQGGMGVVYEARHEQIGQRAAVKVLMRDLARDTRILQRFLDEARTMTLVQHEGIVKVFDYGQLSDGVPYILMEFLEGSSLQDLLSESSARGCGLPLPHAIEIARQVAGAIAALHQRNIIHRDLKPDNLFLVADPLIYGGQRVKLLDFGLAKVLDQEVHRTTDGSILGTPLYMSPEQWQGGHRLSVKSDVYSLGALFYELLVGHPPFHGGTPSELMYQHVNRPAPLLSEVAIDVPHQLDGLLALMLAKAPATRPKMEDVALMLDPLRREAEHRGPLEHWGVLPVRVGDFDSDGLSETLGPKPLTIEKLAVAENLLAGSRLPAVRSESAQESPSSSEPISTPEPARVATPNPSPSRVEPVAAPTSQPPVLLPPTAAARSSSLSAISVSVAPVRRSALWPMISVGIVGVILMTVVGLALRRHRSHSAEAIPGKTAPPIAATANPTTDSKPADASGPTEISKSPEASKPREVSKPVEAPVATAAESASSDETAEASRKPSKRKKRSRTSAADAASGAKADDPMTIFREH